MLCRRESLGLNYKVMDQIVMVIMFSIVVSRSA